MNNTMNSELREQISAFVDGELSDNEAALLVRRLGRDSELREYAGSLMDIGRHMRGERLSADAEFASRLRERMNESDAQDRARGGYRMASAGTAGRPGWWQAAAGGALTLAVAAVALNWMTAVEAPDTVVAETVQSDRVVDPAVESGVAYVVPSEVDNSGPLLANPQLAAYYLNHSVSRRLSSPGGSSAYLLNAESVEERADAAQQDERIAEPQRSDEGDVRR